MVAVSVCAEPLSAISLFNRESTGNFYVFGVEIRRNPMDWPVFIGFQKIFPKNGTGNFKYLTGNYMELSGKLGLIDSHLFAISNSLGTGTKNRWTRTAVLYF